MTKDTARLIALGSAISIACSAACFFINTVCGVICLAAGAIIVGIFAFNLIGRNRALNELNNYLSLICSGNYNLEINENTEGELSILKNNLYKVITILQTQKDVLSRDKSFLADNLADISHQLKTPLTSMLVLIDLVKTESDEQKRREFIEVIEGQLDKTKWLISNLLKLSRLDADTVEFMSEEIMVEELVSEAVKPFLVSLDLKNIALDIDVDELSIYVDKNWTLEALMNIIKNCIEHTERDGRISITADSTNIYTAIIISDNGVGIAAEDLPHIFERFYHGKNSSPESVGIGLALTKQILSKQNAVVDASSVEGEETSFEIRFYKSII